jgi:predicted nuclease of predicted toxin-antitoxin system
LRVLLDENVPHDLRPFLRHHDTVTVGYAGFAGLKNGALLAAAEKAAFEVLVTGDKTLHHEQNLVGRPIAVVSLSAVNWPVIEPHVARIVVAVDEATPGSFTRVECGGFVRPGRRPKGPTLG